MRTLNSTECTDTHTHRHSRPVTRPGKIANPMEKNEPLQNCTEMKIYCSFVTFACSFTFAALMNGRCRENFIVNYRNFRWKLQRMVNVKIMPSVFTEKLYFIACYSGGTAQAEPSGSETILSNRRTEFLQHFERRLLCDVFEWARKL